MFKVLWVEIPVKNLERAMKFYEGVFDLQPMEVIEEAVRRHATLNAGGSEPGGSINLTQNFEPSDKGVLVYLSLPDDLAGRLEKVVALGGKIVADKASMGPGFYAIVLDSEGNNLALYAPN
jgi:predicted enzyme related to lactoylglutathione lyase